MTTVDTFEQAAEAAREGRASERSLVRSEVPSSLRISGIGVDGFGALCGLEIAGIGDGVTVLLGPNEAGKSTLFDFVSAILFGFPSRKADEHYRAPVRGGRHGGRLLVTDPSGGTYTIERYTSPKKELSLTRPDGSLGDETELRRLLRGATAELFRAVFAVGLDDLRQIESVSSEEVREILFSSSILGERRSASAALHRLAEETDHLVRPRQGGRANQLLADLTSARAELKEAREKAASFAELARRREQLGEEIEELRSERDALAKTSREAELLATCWAVQVEIPELEEALTSLPELTAEELALLEAKGRLERARAELSGYLARCKAMEDERVSLAGLETSIAKRVSELGDWSKEAASDPAFDPDTSHLELQELLESYNSAAGVLKSALEDLEREREQAAKIGEAPSIPEGLPAADELSARLSALRELRGWLTEKEQLGREVEHDADRSRAGGSAPIATAYLLCGFAVLLFALGAGLLAATQRAFGAAAFALGAGLAVAAFFTWRVARDRSTGGPAGAGARFADERAAKLERARAEVDNHARQLSLDLPLSAIALEHETEATEELLSKRRSADEHLARHQAAASRLEDAAAKSDQARAALARRREALDGFAASLGAGNLEPSELPRLLARLKELKDRLEGLHRQKGSLDDDSALRPFEEQMVSLASQFALDLPGRDDEAARPGPEWIVSVLAEMEAVLSEVERRSSARNTASQRLAEARAKIETMLGRDEEAERLTAELSTGRAVEWRSRLAEAAERLGSLDEDYRSIVQEHGSLSTKLEELAISTRIPELDEACSTIEAELEHVVGSYLVASGARLLVQRTLRRYEEERQPAVLAFAAEHFSRATCGRYVRLGVDSDPAAQTIRAYRSDGSHVDAASLSRGTTEQLYLCVRLGLAESFAERSCAPPIVLDDVLVNCDPERRRQMASELARTARHHQVLVFTCHPEIAALFTEEAGELPPVQVIELERL